MKRILLLTRPLRRFLAMLLTALCLSAVLAPHCFATKESTPSWQAILKDHPAAPPRLIAVDKDKQQLYVYDNAGSLELKRSYICTTGQKTGDKLIQGDLKTPEGIYFVVQHLNSGLDFFLYGNEAYTLNYPNPVDRLRRKTGYGIWIHGRGETIRPLITQGCIAMQNDDLEVLGNLLSPGTPVALTSSLAYSSKTSPEAVEEAKELRKKVEGWAKAWSNRSSVMFSFYDKEAYSLAQGEDFTKFQAQKERLFKSLPWINTKVENIQVLQGPGYWVTWFYQDYQAPNLSTKGVRRLYWHKNNKGEFVILGMEWLPGLTTGTHVALAEPAMPPVEISPKSEEQATPLPEALADVAKEKERAKAHGTAETLPLPAKGLNGDQIEGIAKPELALVLYEQKRLPSQIKADPLQKTADAEKQPVSQNKSTGSPMKTTLADTTSPSNTKHLDIDLPPPLPSQGLSSGGEEVLLASAPKVPAPSGAIGSPALQSEPEATAKEAMPQAKEKESSTPEPLTTNTSPIEMLVSEKNDLPLVTETKDSASGEDKQPSFDAATESAVREMLEEWRDAWEKGDLELYAEFYTNASTQGGRKGRASIVRHKSGLWKKAAPKKILFSDFTLQPKGSALIVEFKQQYQDVRGQGDTGIKTLRLEHMDKMWFILSEEWRSLDE